MSKVKFGIVGAGWRSEFFLRIAKQLPERFEVTGMVIRKTEKARDFESKWELKTYRTIDELLQKSDLSYVVLSVPRTVAPEIMIKLAAKGVPILCETPPAADLESLRSLYQAVGGKAAIQIAEQYLFQPNHSARLQIAKSGKLGSISQAQISVAHDYHGISLIRQFLGITFEDAMIQAYSFTSPIVNGPNRNGDPAAHEVIPSTQVIASLQFGDKLAVYDFSGDQYFSWIRSPRVLLRGEKGEISNDQVKYLQDYVTPVEQELKRVSTGNDGNLEGYYLRGILFGEQYVYKNAYIPGRLTDDEIAVATCLDKMAQYVDGGPSFYSLAEASQDHYLSLMIQKALSTKETVVSTRQPWAEN